MPVDAFHRIAKRKCVKCLITKRTELIGPNLREPIMQEFCVSIHIQQKGKSP